MKHRDIPFATKTLPAEVDALAPDLDEIRVLLDTPGGGMAHGTCHREGSRSRSRTAPSKHCCTASGAILTCAR